MKTNDIDLPEKIYTQQLAIIDGIKFSRREIDVIACLVKGRATKKISSLLSVSPKTVATHIRNIMLKLDVNSREGILDFIEKSNKNSILLSYYNYLANPDFNEAHNNGTPYDPYLSEVHTASQDPLPREKKKRKVFLAGAICCIMLFIVLMSLKFLPLSVQSKQPEESIRSDILLPNDKVLIKRPKLWAQLDNKLKETQVAVLVGIGGAGKTTLARQYAHQQNANVIWEINAETKSSLIDSFKSLAYRMAKTEEQKNDLNFIQTIQDSEEKEKQLLYFIKKNLKEISNWVLIYDNVDSFSDIKKYFPRDFTVWGKGRVILTTRDSNVGNTSYLNHQQLIQMERLSPLETLTLFSKILYNCEPHHLSPSRQESALKFLQSIPPFPLDVSTAAYYIKNSHISYADYLEKITQANSHFDDVQGTFLQEISDYTKTRYAILTLSFKKLMDTHPEFKELLFLICHMDSQKIPRTFLEFHKGQPTAANFIRDLKKYSLLTNESEDKSHEELAAFSLHRSTQTLGKAFLLNTLREDEVQDYLSHIISSAKSFYTTYSDAKSFYKTSSDKNYSLTLPLISHWEMLLSNLKDISLPQNIKNKHTLDLSFILGYSYFRANRSFLLAKKYFSQILEIPESNQHFSTLTLATLLKDFGEIAISLTDLTQKYSEQSIALCKNLKNAEMIVAENLQTIGDSYRKRNNFERANFYLRQALNEISHLDPKKRQVIESKIYDRLGWLYSVTYIHKPEAKQAKEYLLKSLDVLNASQLFHRTGLNNPENKLPCYVANHKLRLGVINNRLGNYADAYKQGFHEALYIIENGLDSCPHDRFLNARIFEAMGETLLREGKIDQAEEKLSEAIKVIEITLGKTITQTPKSFRTEARIRQGKLAEAYEDCLAVLQITTREKNNFHNLLYLTNHYHAAIIKYKQKDFRKSIEHFTDFFREIKNFCTVFLDEKTYKDLESQGIFTPVSSKGEAITIIKAYLDKSLKIFSAIYGPTHPFVKDYVIKN